MSSAEASSSTNPGLRKKINGPSSYSPRTTAQTQRRFGGLFASLGLAASGSGSPLRPLASLDSTQGSEPTSAREGVNSRPAGGVWSFAERMAELTIGSSPGEGGAKGKAKMTEWADDEGDEGSCKGGAASFTADWCPLMDLPDELLLGIAIHLPPTVGQIHALSMVCTRLHHIAQAPILWIQAFAELEYDLTDRAKTYGVAVGAAPAGRWSGLDWTSDSVAGVQQGPDAVFNHPPCSSPDDGRQATTPDAAQSDVVHIHWPTLVRSRCTLSKRLKSPTFDPHCIVLTVHATVIYCVRVVSGYIISGSRDRSIRITRIPTLCKRRANQEATPRSSTPESDRDRQASCVAKDGYTGGEVAYTLENAHEASVLHMALDADAEGRGVLVTASSDCTIGVWALDLTVLCSAPLQDQSTTGTQARPLRLVKSLRGPSCPVLCVALTPGYIVGGTKEGQLWVYDRTTYQLRATIDAHVGAINGLLAAPSDGSQVEAGDDHVATASADGTWAVWDIPSSTCIVKGGQVRSRGEGFASVAWGGNRLLTGGGNRQIKLWNVCTGNEMLTLKGHVGLVRALAVLPSEGIAVSGGYDRTVFTWDLSSGKTIRCQTAADQSTVLDLETSVKWTISALGEGLIEVCLWDGHLPYADLFV
ncbi:hypothetical protein IAU60_003603 [Kwoniella sp. DSM 27419]